MKPIPLREKNPKGLHVKYAIRKVVGTSPTSFGHGVKLKTKSVDDDAEYFVMRLDLNSDNLDHVLACRKAMQTYANAIVDTIPELADDIRRRWPVEEITNLKP